MSKSSLFNHLPIPSTLKTSTALPPFLYGTAWKKDATTGLVTSALQNGFTAIDTACQPRHYREDLVAEGVRNYLKSNPNKSRKDLYIQSKFTSIHGQDPNSIPYDPRSPLAEQVRKSVETSLRNFTISNDETPYLDALVLHSPMPCMDETLEVWQTLERYVPDKIHHLGISNTNLFTLMELYERSNVKPSIVQNRFYPATKHDIAVRKFCREKGMAYQSFWTLTGNPGLMRSKVVKDVAGELDVGAVQALYVLMLGLGNVVVLNGTTNVENMKADWEAVEKVKFYAQKEAKKWEDLIREFKRMIREVVD